MEVIIPLAGVLVLLPLGFVFSFWLLRAWYRSRGQPAPVEEAQVDWERLWFPQSTAREAPLVPVPQGASSDADPAESAPAGPASKPPSPGPG